MKEKVSYKMVLSKKKIVELNYVAKIIDKYHICKYNLYENICKYGKRQVMNVI